MIHEWLEWASQYWVGISVLIHVSVSSITAMHVVLYKENERTSLAWIGLVVLSPIIGSLFYWIFGVNRIQRFAQKIHPPEINNDIPMELSSIDFHDLPEHWRGSIKSGSNIHPFSRLQYCDVEPLVNGDNAYPAMLESIDNARRHIILSSYIFEHDAIGKQFVAALANAKQRGVTINVLLDGIGIRYGLQHSQGALKKAGIKTARFLPTVSLKGIRFINLRNHRKILCVDGTHAFIGGMNVSKHNVIASSNSPIDDIHFKVTGAVIDQISQVFIEDWYFATGEMIAFPLFDKTNASANQGSVLAKVIQDGPDEHHNKVKWTLINALACAKQNVKIMTPYFVPDSVLMASLHAAALRGITIEIIVPQNSNILFLDWVLQANFSRIIAHGIKLYQNTRPFDHSKIMIIDDVYSFIGSSNWDARSLEFNFEINLECYDKTLNAKLATFFDTKREAARQVTPEQAKGFPIYKRMRNNLFRLFSPYL
ncbi:PLDc N-terminal domain-containing protein [Glaciecola sp. XM2]|jgi:cardiolipin synthase|uniref:phospholipase D-like domain-containing protein n=1 Tax=Glaciecola sp. XM2 TaxID=1914931 RepID=UPI001BDF30FC|nr:phospholipase D-like domain-containing protein [Glaciecola sp. XM2]MBT1450043.1 PLDc N-terminal domain-containing protein [Glaciecola sp. XM2]